MLGRVRSNVHERGAGVGIWVVVPKESLHLGSLINNGHDGEVILVVPAPGDTEGSLLPRFSI